MKCPQCSKNLSCASSLRRHEKESCPKRFNSDSRILSTPSEPPIKRQKTVQGSVASTSRKDQQNLVTPLILKDGVEKLNSAFKCRICSYRFSANQITIDHKQFFEDIRRKVLDIIETYIQEYRSLKVNCELFSLYVKPDTEAVETKSFNTKNVVVTVADDLNQVYETFIQSIMVKADHFQEKDSGKF